MAKKLEETHEEDFDEFVITTVSSVSSDLHAVFYDPDEEDWSHFPVVAMVVGSIVPWRNGKATKERFSAVRGMVSNHGGLEVAEDVEDLEFIGYWRRDSQPDFDDFLSDHGIDVGPRPAKEDDPN